MGTFLTVGSIVNEPTAILFTLLYVSLFVQYMKTHVMKLLEINCILLDNKEH
jgi:hypothetical protein